MRELVELRLKTTSGFLSEVDRIVVPAEWARDVLLVNNVDPAKIVLSRHGIDGTAPSNDPAAPAPPPLRLAFLGRIGPAKGADILIDAIRLLPDAPVELDLYGIVQDANAGKSWDDLIRSAQGDARIRFHRAVSPAEVIALLTRYHLLAVPSRWLETGTPVLGMDRGGIAELVHDGSNGLLVGSEAPEAWRDAILRVLEHPELLERLQAGVRAPRTMDQVAAEMSALYQGLQLNATVVP
jgi:glycosyltransferase involved in cell wall biosynthesis